LGHNLPGKTLLKNTVFLDVSEELAVSIFFAEGGGNRSIPNVGKSIPHHMTVRFQVQEMSPVSHFAALVFYITTVPALDIDKQAKFRKITGSLCVGADLHFRSL
jgi:hypothetical protein